MTQLTLKFPPAPLPVHKGAGARRAEKLGHTLRWEWSENTPIHERWVCIDCDGLATDRVPPGPGWNGIAGNAPYERCPGPD